MPEHFARNKKAVSPERDGASCLVTIRFSYASRPHPLPQESMRHHQPAKKALANNAVEQVLITTNSFGRRLRPHGTNSECVYITPPFDGCQEARPRFFSLLSLLLQPRKKFFRAGNGQADTPGGGRHVILRYFFKSRIISSTKLHAFSYFSQISSKVSLS